MSTLLECWRAGRGGWVTGLFQRTYWGLCKWYAEFNASWLCITKCDRLSWKVMHHDVHAAAYPHNPCQKYRKSPIFLKLFSTIALCAPNVNSWTTNKSSPMKKWQPIHEALEKNSRKDNVFKPFPTISRHAPKRERLSKWPMHNRYAFGSIST